MKNNSLIAERNRIVEENLPRIDRAIRRNRVLMCAAHLDSNVIKLGNGPLNHLLGWLSGFEFVEGGHIKKQKFSKKHLTKQ